MRQAIVVVLLLLSACAGMQERFEEEDSVRLFLAMAPDAMYTETRFSGAEASALADLVRAECPQAQGAFVRGVYSTQGASLILYASDTNVTCAIFRPGELGSLESAPAEQAPEGVALTVNGQPITATELQERLALLSQGDPAAVEQAVQQAINDELLRQEAAGIPVSEEELAESRRSLLDQLGVSDASEAGVSQDVLEEQAAAQARLSKLLRERLLIEDIAVSEDVAREYYLENPNEFLVSEQAVMRHLFVSAEGRTPEELEARAQAVAGALQGEDFCALVLRYSDDRTEQCGTFVVPKGIIDPSLEHAAFNTPRNQTSVVQLPDGVHFVQTIQVLPAQVVPFGDVSERLQSSLLNSVFQQRLALYLSILRSRADVVVYVQ